MTLTALVDKYLGHYNDFRTEELVDMFTDDCVFQNVTNTAGIVECIGKDELRSVCEQSKELFQKRKQTVTNWIIDGDKIAVEVDYTAVMACDLPNGLQKGDCINIRGVSVFIFENGKIKQLTDYS